MAQKQQLKASEYHLTKQEVKRLINSAPTFRDRCILKTLAHTAMRRFELVGMDIRDIDFERRRIHIREGKGGKERTIPCSEELLADLRHLIGGRKTGLVFQSNRGKGFDLSQINKIVANSGRLAGLENPNPRYRNINPHLLRHSFARLWKDAGKSTESLSKILGHTSVKTTLDEYGTEDLETVQKNFNAVITEIF